MSFSLEQTAEMEKPLSRAFVKEREQAGRKFNYVEGWHVVSEANRIFGFGGWSRETITTACVMEKERTIGRPPKEKPGWGVSYIARVRIHVGGIYRDGIGSGHGIDADLGQAHESAIKEAETDATKRALSTFGNPFGLALYDKEQANVEEVESVASRYERESIEFANQCDDAEELKAWYGAEKDRRRQILSNDAILRLKDHITRRLEEIKSRQKKPA